jgi:two-component system OmpR family sensor kinase
MIANSAFLAAIVLGVLVVAATAYIALRVTNQALRPVAVMAERAVDWSEHDLSHRFALGPPTNELAALGGTLDALLDRVASAIRSEQRLTSELAHELRTPLTGIQGTADLALLRGVSDTRVREDLEQISASAREMGAVITTLLDLARDGTTSGREQCRLADVVPAWVAAVGRDLEVVDRTSGSTATIAAPAGLVTRAVSPLVDNASRHAHSTVVLEATDHPDHVELVVRDDGDGVAPEVRASLFEPGVSHGSGGAGLGLGIAQRIARSLGGDVTLGPDPGGAVFVVRLPRR